jgi:hypothetical protein
MSALEKNSYFPKWDHGHSYVNANTAMDEYKMMFGGGKAASESEPILQLHNTADGAGSSSSSAGLGQRAYASSEKPKLLLLKGTEMQKQADRELQIAGGTSALTRNYAAESSAAVARRNEELRKMVLSRKQMQHMTLSPQIGTGSPQLASASSRSSSSSSSSGSSSAVVKKSLERSKDEARSNSASNHLNTRKMHGNSESEKELKHYLAKELSSSKKQLVEFLKKEIISKIKTSNPPIVTEAPSLAPSNSPTEHPSRPPSRVPTDEPTPVPTQTPSLQPSGHPTKKFDLKNLKEDWLV